MCRVCASASDPATTFIVKSRSSFVPSDCPGVPGPDAPDLIARAAITFSPDELNDHDIVRSVASPSSVDTPHRTDPVTVSFFTSDCRAPTVLSSDAFTFIRKSITSDSASAPSAFVTTTDIDVVPDPAEFVLSVDGVHA